MPVDPTVLVPDFKWPEVLAGAMNSVTSEFNPHRHEPRLYAPSDAALTADIVLFADKTINYYDVEVAGMTQMQLWALVKRKLNYRGEVLAAKGGD